MLKQAPGLQPISGFLESTDFSMLFEPMPSGLSEREQQERLRQQRTRLVQAFLPFLQQQLIRQFIVQTLTAHTGTDLALVESFVTDERLLAIASSTPLLSAFAETGERGITATYWFSEDQSGVALITQLRSDNTSSQAGKVSNPVRSISATKVAAHRKSA
jgi:hypothetical protein